MRIVEDEAGRRYLLKKRSAESSLVCAVDTGKKRYLANDRLTVVDGVDPIVVAAATVPQDVRHELPTVHDEHALGLLVLLAQQPRPVRTILNVTDLCESDLLGIATELRAAGLIRETTVEGERGYAATDAAQEALEGDQSAGASSADASD